ncbi:MAG: hypothetical protein GY841_15540 [FCB group bacterium]|nr:hypothetical protein [FCB group bacterium]
MNEYIFIPTSILDSSVWQEPPHIRLTWITMMLMENKKGVVEASIPGLARRVGVTVAECIESLDFLKNPDEYNISKNFEGRRIKETSEGWIILEHDKHSAKLQKQRTQSAERGRRFRERKKEREKERMQSGKCEK